MWVGEGWHPDRPSNEPRGRLVVTTRSSVTKSFCEWRTPSPDPAATVCCIVRRPARERERFRTRLGLVTLCACAMDASDERGTAAVHVLICALVSLVGKAGDALSPALLSSRPFLLLLLNASDAHLALTASLCSDSIASALCWLALVVARRCGEDGCYYFLGRHHGSAVAGRLLGVDLQKAGESYQRASLLALFAFPTAPVCILAGAGGASVRMFFAADVCATLLRASALLLLTTDSFSPAEKLLHGARSLAAAHPTVALSITSALATPGLIAAIALLHRSWQSWVSSKQQRDQSPSLTLPSHPPEMPEAACADGAGALVDARADDDGPGAPLAPRNPPVRSPPPSPPSSSPTSSRSSSPTSKASPDHTLSDGSPSGSPLRQRSSSSHTSDGSTMEDMDGQRGSASKSTSAATSSAQGKVSEESGEEDEEGDEEEEEDDDESSSGSTSTSPSVRKRRLLKSLQSPSQPIRIGRLEMPPRPIVTRRRLVPRGADKWGLISSAVGTTNALQATYIEVRNRTVDTRVHPRGREPGNVGANWAPRTRNQDGEFAPDWLAGLRVGHASLYSSWERCSRFCKDDELALHIAMCKAARQALRHNPLVSSALVQFWDAIKDRLPPPPPGKPPTARKKHYVDMHLRFHKALMPFGELSAGFNESEAIKMAEADWELDRVADDVIGREETPVMRKDTWLNAVFNVADAYAPRPLPCPSPCHPLFPRMHACCRHACAS